ncbi:hypothetical protein OGA32_000104 [Salmonella enterica]|nr:hypothetical protein [Salmonella enterica]
MNQAQATQLTTVLIEKLKASNIVENMAILSGVDVDTFIAVSDYENNRPVEERALSQAKAKDKISKHLSPQVAVVLLDRVRNKALWERTEREARAKNIAHTLPFIKANGHTRAYGWSHRIYAHDTSYKPSSILSPEKIGAHNINNYELFPYLFTRPDSLLLTVHMNLTDDEIYTLVKDEYCGKIGVATNKEAQQMGFRKVEFSPQSDFVTRDSWLTAFKLVDPNYRKNVHLAYEELRDALDAIDRLNITAKAPVKRYAGIRTSLIMTYYIAVKHEQETKLREWIEFWSDFYSDNPSNVTVTTLLSGLTAVASNDSKSMIDKCKSSFDSFIA